ncbi:MAG TPA: redoxin family protein [Candidatus Cybelea sp.]|jgi:thiol-disulfide isomerase/thioredoxin
MNRRYFVLAGVLTAAAAASLPARAAQATLGPLYSAAQWINGRVTAPDLAGHVVVLDIFTVDCSNCQNVVPNLRALNANNRARGLRIVGIHAPETPAERGRAYVEQSLARQGIVWPVAIDNDFALWKAYGADAWPTQLFFDRQGRLRKVIVGDSQDEQVRATVESLLRENAAARH